MHEIVICTWGELATLYRLDAIIARKQGFLRLAETYELDATRLDLTPERLMRPAIIRFK